MYAFWKGLNAFRLSESGEVFRRSEKAPESYYNWIEPVNPYQLGYFVDNKVLVLLNTESKTNDFNNIYFPRGNWELIANSNAVDHENGVADQRKYLNIQGQTTRNIRMEPLSLRIWVIRDTGK
jgi:hypothetical protein